MLNVHSHIQIWRPLSRTVDDLLSLDLVGRQSRQHVPAHQLLPVWRVCLQLVALIILALHLDEAQRVHPAHERNSDRSYRAGGTGF